MFKRGSQKNDTFPSIFGINNYLVVMRGEDNKGGKRKEGGEESIPGGLKIQASLFCHNKSIFM